MSVTLQIRRGTRAQLAMLAAQAGLTVGEPFLITDEARIAVALTTGTYSSMAKLSEAGGGGGASALSALTDVSLTGLSDGNLLNFESVGALWKPTNTPRNQLIDGGNF